MPRYLANSAVASFCRKVTAPEVSMATPKTWGSFGSIWAIAGMQMLVKQDGISRKTFDTHRREALARNDNRGVTRIRDGIRAYFRRDFHPNDGLDRLPLARARLAEVIPGLG